MNSVYDQVSTTLYAVWRKRWYGLAAAWAVCLVGWIVVAAIPNSFESNARIYVKWSNLLPAQLGYSSGDKARQIDIVRQTLTSRPNLEKVIRRTDLALQANDDEQLDALIKNLTDSITVRSQQDDLFTLTYTSSLDGYSDTQTAAMSQRVVQNLINIFVEENISSDRDALNQAIRFYEDQLAQRGRELEEAEKRRADFELRYLGRMPGEGSVSERLRGAQSELERVTQEQQQAQSSLGALQAQLSSTPATIAGASIVFEQAGGYSGPRFNPASAQGRIEALERQITDSYARGWTDQHPDVVAARRQIANLQKDAAREAAAPKDARQQAAQANPVYVNLRSLVFDKQSAVAALGSRRSQLTSSIAALQKAQVDEPGISAEQAKLNRDYGVLRTQYNALLQQRESVRLRSDVENKTESVRFQIIDPPSMPRAPVAPNRPLLLSGVLAGAIAVGIGVAFLLSQVHATYITGKRLQDSFGVPVLGSVSEIVSDQQRAQNRMWLLGFAVLGVGLIGIYAALLIYEIVQMNGVA